MVIFYFLALFAGFFRKEFSEDESFKSELDYFENFLNTTFRDDFICDGLFISYLFDNERLFFEIQGSIIFVDFVQSKCFFTINFALISDPEIEYEIKTKYILNMAENHIVQKTINYSRFFWILSIILLIIFMSNLLSGLLLWIILIISSKKELIVILFCFLIFIGLIIQGIIFLIRLCNPHILKKYEKESRNNKFELNEEELKKLNKKGSRINKMTSEELKGLLKSRSKMGTIKIKTDESSKELENSLKKSKSSLKKLKSSLEKSKSSSKVFKSSSKEIKSVSSKKKSISTTKSNNKIHPIKSSKTKSTILKSEKYESKSLNQTKDEASEKSNQKEKKR